MRPQCGQSRALPPRAGPSSFRRLFVEACGSEALGISCCHSKRWSGVGDKESRLLGQALCNLSKLGSKRLAKITLIASPALTPTGVVSLPQLRRNRVMPSTSIFSMESTTTPPCATLHASETHSRLLQYFLKCSSWTWRVSYGHGGTRSGFVFRILLLSHDGIVQRQFKHHFQT